MVTQPQRSARLRVRLTMGVLPYARNCYTDADDVDGSRFAQRCRMLEMRHGLPLQTPAYLAIDNARTHPQGRKMCSMMWQEHLDAGELYRECEQWFRAVGDDIDSDPALLAAANAHIAACAQDGYAIDQHEVVSALWTSCTHKCTNEASAPVRSLAASVQKLQAVCDADPTACGHPPQLVAPLSDKTPDINSPAENDVCFLKGYVETKVSEFVLDRLMDAALEKASTYWNLVLEKAAWLCAQDGLRTCLCAVKNGVVRVQPLAADVGELVAVEKWDILKKVDHDADGGQRREIRVRKMTGDGLAGSWVADGVFIG